MVLLKYWRYPGNLHVNKFSFTKVAGSHHATLLKHELFERHESHRRKETFNKYSLKISPKF